MIRCEIGCRATLLHHITGRLTFECGLPEDLHSVELVVVGRGHLSHQEHLQRAEQRCHKKKHLRSDQGLWACLHLGLTLGLGGPITDGKLYSWSVLTWHCNASQVTHTSLWQIVGTMLIKFIKLLLTQNLLKLFFLVIGLVILWVKSAETVLPQCTWVSSHFYCD